MKIQDRINKTLVPSDIGRIPHKIESSFYHFTADQYKNWVLHYSIICLHGLLSHDHMECWRLFVSACRLLCRPVISRDEVNQADTLLLQFCQRIEQLFGKEIITPNMHMCCHLKECILDYGPLNHFWLFAFERFNGILGQLPKNNRSVEVQIMKRFLSDCDVMRVPVPKELKKEFFKYTCFEKDLVGTLGADLSPNVDHQIDVSLSNYYTRCVFDSSEIEDLSTLLQLLYPSSTCASVNTTYKKYSIAVVKGKTYCSFKSRAKCSSIVLAELNGQLRPTRVNIFSKVVASVDDNSVILILFSLNWFKSNMYQQVCGEPVTVWEHDIFDACGFLPAQSIKCRTISLVDKLIVDYGSVLFVSPYE